MEEKIPRLVIAATQSGSGKTTLVTGILAALRAQGLRVQSYKVGPDYIDPGYHALASGLPAHNLDTWLMPAERLKEIFARTAKGADLAVIEGVMGLYDGGRKGVSSTAEIAKLLDAPVLLALDAKSMGASAAAIALGFRSYDREVKLAGVLLNRLGSDTHEAMIREAMAKIDMPVLGAMRRDESLKMPERHLGLLPVEENEERDVIKKMGEAAAHSVDLAALRRIAAEAAPLALTEEMLFPASENAERQPSKVRLAVAHDEAFSFYYPESLDVLESFGAELVFFSPLHDAALPEAAGVLLGGGFPEMFAEELTSNASMRRSLAEAAAAGVPIYAECGGYMYLMEKLVDFEGKEHAMTGIVPAVVQMNRKLQMVGYVEAELCSDTVLGPRGRKLHGHEFHFSTELPQEETDAARAFVFTRMRNGAHYAAGYAKGAVLGSYLHLHFAGCPEAAEAFVEACRASRERRKMHG